MRSKMASSKQGGGGGGGRRATEITDIHPNVIETHIFTRIDTQTQASIACTSRMFRAMSANERLWRDICNSTWPSTKHSLVRDTISIFPGRHHSFFSDSFPVLHPDHHRLWRNSICRRAQLDTTAELISAVDIHYKNKLLCSKVEVTNTRTDTFRSSAFRVRLLDPVETINMMPGIFVGYDQDMLLSDIKEYMTLSWIIIDPALKRAANVSSLWPVSVRRHWIGGDIEVKYAAILAGDYRDGMTKLVECRIVAMLGWKQGRELELRGVNLEVKDMDAKWLSGKDSLGILHEAMQGGTRKKGKKGEEKESYRKFVALKRERREGKERRVKRLKLVFKLIPAPVPATIFVGLVFLAFWAFVVLSTAMKTI